MTELFGKEGDQKNNLVFLAVNHFLALYKYGMFWKFLGPSPLN